MTQKTKIKNILRALGEPSAVSDSFQAFEDGIKKLKKDLEEKVEVRTLEEVNEKLDKFRNRISIDPLVEAVENIERDFNEKSVELINHLEYRIGELKKLVGKETSSKQEMAEVLSTEIESVRSELLKLEREFQVSIDKIQERISSLPKPEKIELPKIEKVDLSPLEKKIVQLREEAEGAIEKLRKDTLTLLSSRGGGNANRQILNNGSVLGTNFIDLNLIPAGGLTISAANNATTKRTDVTLTAIVSSGVLTATGTIDDTNTTFTFVSLPSVLVINGAVYRQTGGAITWTWTGGTLTATLSSAVGTGGSIFGLT